jgi:hypothetical protein
VLETPHGGKNYKILQYEASDLEERFGEIQITEIGNKIYNYNAGNNYIFSAVHRKQLKCL